MNPRFIIWLVIVVATYLIVAFVQADWDFSHWSGTGRAILAVGAVGGGIFALAVDRK